MHFCDPEDLPRLEPGIAIDVKDVGGKYQLAIDNAMDELDTRLRAYKSTAEPIELGRLGIRSKNRLRRVCAAFALFWLYDTNKTFGDAAGSKFSERADTWSTRAIEWLDMEAEMMDYDADNSGTIDDFEKNQPMPRRFLRG